eukprot:g25296.t1
MSYHVISYHVIYHVIYHIISYHIISYHIISYHIISYHIISHHIISYHIISYHIISYHIISYHIISYHIISYHIISYRIVSYRIVSYRIVSYRIVSYRIVSYRIVSYRIVSYRIVSYRIVSYRIVSYRIVSYRIVSYRIVSYRIVSYRIVSYRIVSYRVVSCRVVSCRVVSCRVVSYRTVPYRTVPCRTVPCAVCRAVYRVPCTVYPVCTACTPCVPRVPRVYRVYPVCTACTPCVPRVPRVYRVYPVCTACTPCVPRVPRVPRVYRVYPVCTACTPCVPRVPRVYRVYPVYRVPCTVYHVVKDLGDHRYWVRERDTGEEREVLHKPKAGTHDGLLEVRPTDLESDDTDDLVLCGDMSEPMVLHTMRERLAKRLIYTRIDQGILIAINPFCELGSLVTADGGSHSYYGPELSQLYAQQASTGGGRDAGIGEEQLPPHIFELAQSLLHGLFYSEEKKPQSCIISGESGAGKTVATKHVLLHLARTAGADRGVGLNENLGFAIDQRLLEANPILEAFGNAKTDRNNNSSRFGKYIEVFFSPKHKICGGLIANFLLEKQRVVALTTPTERNFHIFYWLCRGTSHAQRTELLLNKGVEHFYYLMHDVLDRDCSVPGEDDQEELKKVTDAMQGMEFSPLEQQSIFQIAAGILWVGNIQFEENPSQRDEVMLVKERSDDPDSPDALSAVATLLMLKKADIEKAFTTKRIRAGSSWVTKQFNISQAESARDALSKFVYNSLFNWLVDKVNLSVRGGDITQEAEKARRSIGILDIFGFEIFLENSLEQLCINFTNERLQARFNQEVFQKEMDLYSREGIVCDDFSFVDNQPILDLIEGKQGSKGGKDGLLLLLDESTMLGTDSEYDDQYFRKILQLHAEEAPRGRNTSFGAGKGSRTAGKSLEVGDIPVQRKKGHKRDHSMSLAFTGDAQEHAILYEDRKAKHRNSFVVKHYAGPVSYNTNGWTLKNKDELAEELLYLVLSSRLAFLSTLFELFPPGTTPEEPTLSNSALSPNTTKRRISVQQTQQNKNRKASLTSRFRANLNTLNTKLGPTQPHFVRCIKANENKAPMVFQSGIIVKQLIYSGVFEAIKIRKRGYPFRRTHANFCRRYGGVTLEGKKNMSHAREGSKEAARALLEALMEKSGLSSAQVGRTLVLYRAPEHRLFELFRSLMLENHVLALQKAARMVLVRRRWKMHQQTVQQLIAALKGAEDLSTPVPRPGEDPPPYLVRQLAALTAAMDKGHEYLDLTPVVIPLHRLRALMQEAKDTKARLEEAQATQGELKRILASGKKPDEVYDRVTSLLETSQDLAMETDKVVEARAFIQHLVFQKDTEQGLREGVTLSDRAVLNKALAQAKELGMREDSELLQNAKLELERIDKEQRFIDTVLLPATEKGGWRGWSGGNDDDDNDRSERGRSYKGIDVSGIEDALARIPTELPDGRLKTPRGKRLGALAELLLKLRLGLTAAFRKRGRPDERHYWTSLQAQLAAERAMTAANAPAAQQQGQDVKESKEPAWKQKLKGLPRDKEGSLKALLHNAKAEQEMDFKEHREIAQAAGLIAAQVEICITADLLREGMQEHSLEKLAQGLADMARLQETKVQIVSGSSLEEVGKQARAERDLLLSLLAKSRELLENLDAVESRWVLSVTRNAALLSRPKAVESKESVSRGASRRLSVTQRADLDQDEPAAFGQGAGWEAVERDAISSFMSETNEPAWKRRAQLKKHEVFRALLEVLAAMDREDAKLRLVARSVSHGGWLNVSRSAPPTTPSWSSRVPPGSARRSTIFPVTSSTRSIHSPATASSRPAFTRNPSWDAGAAGGRRVQQEEGGPEDQSAVQPGDYEHYQPLSSLNTAPWVVLGSDAFTSLTSLQHEAGSPGYIADVYIGSVQGKLWERLGKAVIALRACLRGQEKLHRWDERVEPLLSALEGVKEECDAAALGLPFALTREVAAVRAELSYQQNTRLLCQQLTQATASRDQQQLEALLERCQSELNMKSWVFPELGEAQKLLKQLAEVRAALGQALNEVSIKALEAALDQVKELGGLEADAQVLQARTALLTARSLSEAAQTHSHAALQAALAAAKEQKLNPSAVLVVRAEESFKEVGAIKERCALVAARVEEAWAGRGVSRGSSAADEEEMMACLEAAKGLEGGGGLVGEPEVAKVREHLSRIGQEKQGALAELQAALSEQGWYNFEVKSGDYTQYQGTAQTVVGSKRLAKALEQVRGDGSGQLLTALGRKAVLLGTLVLQVRTHVVQAVNPLLLAASESRLEAADVEQRDGKQSQHSTDQQQQQQQPEQEKKHAESAGLDGSDLIPWSALLALLDKWRPKESEAESEAVEDESGESDSEQAEEHTQQSAHSAQEQKLEVAMWSHPELLSALREARFHVEALRLLSHLDTDAQRAQTGGPDHVSKAQSLAQTIAAARAMGMQARFFPSLRQAEQTLLKVQGLEAELKGALTGGEEAPLVLALETATSLDYRTPTVERAEALLQALRQVQASWEAKSEEQLNGALSALEKEHPGLPATATLTQARRLQSRLAELRLKAEGALREAADAELGLGLSWEQQKILEALLLQTQDQALGGMREVPAVASLTALLTELRMEQAAAREVQAATERGGWLNGRSLFSSPHAGRPEGQVEEKLPARPTSQPAFGQYDQYQSSSEVETEELRRALSGLSALVPGEQETAERRLRTQAGRFYALLARLLLPLREALVPLELGPRIKGEQALWDNVTSAVNGPNQEWQLLAALHGGGHVEDYHQLPNKLSADDGGVVAEVRLLATQLVLQLQQHPEFLAARAEAQYQAKARACRARLQEPFQSFDAKGLETVLLECRELNLQPSFAINRVVLEAQQRLAKLALLKKALHKALEQLELGALQQVCAETAAFLGVPDHGDAKAENQQSTHSAYEIESSFSLLFQACRALRDRLFALEQSGAQAVRLKVLGDLQSCSSAARGLKYQSPMTQEVERWLKLQQDDPMAFVDAQIAAATQNQDQARLFDLRVEKRSLEIQKGREDLLYQPVNAHCLQPAVEWAKSAWLVWDRRSLAAGMMRCSMTSLHAPLTTLVDDNEEIKLVSPQEQNFRQLAALEVFSHVQTFMRAEEPNLELKAAQIVKAGLGTAWIRNEIFLQLIKQCSDVPLGRTRDQVWKLLGLCLTFFSPRGQQMECIVQTFLELHGAAQLVKLLHTQLFGNNKPQFSNELLPVELRKLEAPLPLAKKIFEVTRTSLQGYSGPDWTLDTDRYFSPSREYQGPGKHYGPAFKVLVFKFSDRISFSA